MRGIDVIKGYLCVVAAAIMWASSGTVGKGLFSQGMTPFELVQIRVTLSALLMALVLGIWARGMLRIRLRDVGYFLLLGSIGMTMVQGTYFYTISKIQVAAAILIQYMAPIFVAFYAFCFWKERLTPSKLLAILLALSGCYLVVGGYNLQLLQMNRQGIMGGLASAVCFAGYTLLGERGMHRYPPWTVLFYAMAFSALAWHILYPPFHYAFAGFSRVQWAWILYITVVGTILPFGLYFVGINYIRSTRASITATLEPISAGLFAFVFLKEALEPLQVLGGILVVSAIVLLQLRQEQDEMAPEDPQAKGLGLRSLSGPILGLKCARSEDRMESSLSLYQGAIYASCIKGGRAARGGRDCGHAIGPGPGPFGILCLPPGKGPLHRRGHGATGQDVSHQRLLHVNPCAQTG